MKSNLTHVLISFASGVVLTLIVTSTFICRSGRNDHSTKQTSAYYITPAHIIDEASNEVIAISDDFDIALCKRARTPSYLGEAVTVEGNSLAGEVVADSDIDVTFDIKVTDSTKIHSGMSGKPILLVETNETIGYVSSYVRDDIIRAIKK